MNTAMAIASDRASAFLETAREVLEIECAALEGLGDRLGDSFVAAAEAILTTKGSVVVCGVGKSGIAARKVAATFASTGTPSVFLHPSEAVHGDIGVVGSGDTVIAVSKSGEGEEVLRILPVFREIGARIIAITGNTSSTLARQADIVLDATVEREACPMDLVPTASTLASIALGDALAVVVLGEKDIDRDHLAQFHPGGAIGRRLLLRVADVMHTGDELPSIGQDALMKDAIYEIMSKRLGMTTVVDPEGRLVGIVTDGDLKRILVSTPDILNVRVGDVMIKDPKSIGRDELVAAALETMETVAAGPITSLIVLDDGGRPEGVIHIHDCLQAVG